MIDDKDNNYQPAFFITPRHIFDLPGITLAYIKVYETVFQFWNHKKQCYLTNKNICKRTGIVNERTVRDALKYFEDHKELVRRVKGTRRYLVQPVNYVEVPEEEEDIKNDQSDKNCTETSQGGLQTPPCTNNSQGGSTDPGGAGLQTRGGGSTDPHNNKNLNKELNKSFYPKNDRAVDNSKKHDWAIQIQPSRPQLKDGHRLAETAPKASALLDEYMSKGMIK